MDAMMKFSELDSELAARTYVGMAGTFMTSGVVDEERRKAISTSFARSSKFPSSAPTIFSFATLSE